MGFSSAFSRPACSRPLTADTLSTNKIGHLLVTCQAGPRPPGSLGSAIATVFPRCGGCRATPASITRNATAAYSTKAGATMRVDHRRGLAGANGGRRGERATLLRLATRDQVGYYRPGCRHDRGVSDR